MLILKRGFADKWLTMGSHPDWINHSGLLRRSETQIWDNGYNQQNDQPRRTSHVENIIMLLNQPVFQAQRNIQWADQSYSHWLVSKTTCYPYGRFRLPTGLHKLCYPTIWDRSTWSKFGAYMAFLVTVLKMLTYALVSTWFSVNSGWEHVKRKMHPCCAEPCVDSAHRSP